MPKSDRWPGAVRLILFSSLLTLLLYLPTNPAPRLAARAAPARLPPNVVVVMADDLDDALTQRLLDGGHLPHIRTFVRDEGTWFRNAYVTVSLCCPSRATFLTGQYAHNHGVLGNDLPSGSVALLDDSSTLATWLQDSGYAVGHVGKYLNRYASSPQAPTGSPLNPFYVPPGYDYWRGLTKTYIMYDYEVNEDGALVPYGTAVSDYQTDVLAQMAAAFITAQEAADLQPFFLIVTPLAPHIESEPGAPTIPGCTHTPWSRTLRPAPRHGSLLATLSLPQPPSFNEADLSDKPPLFQANFPAMTPEDVACAQKQYQNRAESMLAVDDLVGTLVTTLQTHGEWDHTVFIFTSDNGYYVGEHRLYQKVFPYEEGIRVPLLMRVPGTTPGQVVDQVVLNNDLAPTIAELAGVTPGLDVDGRSLLPLLHDPALTPWRDAFLVTFQGHLIQFGYFPHFTAVRSAADYQPAPDQLFVTWEDRTTEHYDLAADPFQLASRHADPQLAPQRRALERLRRQLLTCSGAACRSAENGIVPFEAYLPFSASSP
ncbi:MAG: sulfatase [Anaerolineales bacterium]|nr:sulfatase [Anaerolineales bacterium]